MLVEGLDYYINADGNYVFIREYHIKRGYCCTNKCLHCPWNFGKGASTKQINIKQIKKK